MDGLDPRSLIVIAGLLALICVIIMFALRRSFPRSIAGLATWAWATVAMVVCGLLFGLRGTIPDFFSIVLANTMLVGAALAMLVALRRFGELPRLPRWLVVGGLALLATAMAWFTYGQPLYPARLLIVTFILTLLFGHLALLAWRVGKGSFASGVTALASGTTALFAALRFGSTLLALDTPQSLFDKTTFQMLYLAAFNVTALISTLGFILMANDRLRETVEHIASHDLLSGAFSRRAFLEMAEAELARSLRHGRPLALLMFDLDHFKAINDRYGHLVGDRVISDFARRTQSILRRQDMLGRYGGEEFVALLPETGLDEARNAAERICRGLGGSDDLPAYTVSIGAARAYPGMPLNALLMAADQALYQAKANGRNRVEVAGDAADAAESASAGH
ncbi:MAG: GGDEF domain-containing protein [Gammaproteobacteria bacterium]|nr:GGDEF domain-containing protein [Gammaproteobacteria bacterium]MBU1645154.1 GGDEF domain-containing protein [Gammaproteobacteria bacterium]MBU1973391.1 GGDEF domain-containing protein [Gammaproteobacteria bacterium]